MPPLPSKLRNDLETVVKKARVVAERGAKAALESLTVHESRSGGHLDPAGKAMRAKLRAHAKQLGDERGDDDSQQIPRLVREVAYEHWHRMLFARFLAENDLLLRPEGQAPVSLEEVEELARDEGSDPWELASRYAQKMLPRIFRVDDPVLAVKLPRERRTELEELLKSLPAETFTADDSLGWVYQFWQAAEKEAVNKRVKSGEKITGETLPAVTQLFTEHYMVQFLLHNTIGAWHAGKTLSDDQRPSANSEQELQDAVRLNALGGYDFEYLRFVREARDGEDLNAGTGPWRPAAGTYEGWPREAKSLRVLDPCCGSGHFLVAAFDLLVRLRIAEENLSTEAAIRAVLADNLFGLELDARCTQIAAFNLAFAAWKLAGKPIDLPALNIACSGIGPQSTKHEWLKMAEPELARERSDVREAMRRGLTHMHELFSDAPELGSLIDPSELPTQGFAADFETIKPLLDRILAAESDDEAHERAVAARGMAAAAEILAGDYTLVITNVPYLKGGDHGEVLKQFCEENYRDAKYDIANVMASRCMKLLSQGGTSAIVSQQYWLFLKYCDGLREGLLNRYKMPLIARIGPGAFETIGGDVVNVCLQILTRRAPVASYVHTGSELGHIRDLGAKIEALRNGALFSVPQARQLKNPDFRISFEPASSHVGLLSDVADFGKGSVSGDGYRYLRNFWEVDRIAEGHKFWLNSPSDHGLWCGREEIILWGVGNHNPEEQTGFAFRGHRVFGKRGVAIGKAGRLRFTPYDGELFDDNIAVICPYDDADLGAVWEFCRSEEFLTELRRLDKKMSVTAGTFTKVACSPDNWKPASNDDYLREPQSNDPTQWLFHGRPDQTEVDTTLQVAVARLVGYNWPAEHDPQLRLAAEARAWVETCKTLDKFADDDGVVCLSPVRGESPAADRLRTILAAAFGKAWSSGKEHDLLAAAAVKCNGGQKAESLEEWLRDRFFIEHCDTFHDRPFVWHIWDGLKDGFHALVNYHRLAGPKGESRRTLDALTYAYLGDWINAQKQQVAAGKAGAEARLTAALELQEQLNLIAAGEPPYDIFVRWKPLHEQAIGWEPDINDGVRLNIRPFIAAEIEGGRAGAGILRWKPGSIKWTSDRGKEPQSLRPKADFPWFWSCNPDESAAHQTDFAGGKDFDGVRWNDLHYTNEVKQAARDRHAKEAKK